MLFFRDAQATQPEVLQALPVFCVDTPLLLICFSYFHNVDCLVFRFKMPVQLYVENQPATGV